MTEGPPRHLALVPEAADQSPADFDPQQQGVELALGMLIDQVADDPGRLDETPARAARLWNRLTSGTDVDVSEVLAESSDHSPLISASAVPFMTLCERHLLPFFGVATVAVIPAGETGPTEGQLRRLVDTLASRLSRENRLAREVTAALDLHCGPAGSACHVRQLSTCHFLLGGATEEITLSTTGLFQTSDQAHADFQRLIAET